MENEVDMVLRNAYKEAKERGHEFITPEHVLYVATDFPYLKNMLIEFGLDSEKLKKELNKHLTINISKVKNKKIEPKHTIGFDNMIQKSFEHTVFSDKKILDMGNIILSIYGEKNSFGSFCLQKFGIKKYDLVQFVSQKSDIKDDIKDDKKEMKIDSLEAELSKRNKKKSVLDEWTTNLNEEAKLGKIEPLILRDDVLYRIMNVLCRKKKNNPILIGESGVGKSALIEGLAYKIQNEDIPDILKKYKILSLDLGSLVAGTRYRGDFEERIKMIIKETEKRDDIILFIDEIHNLVGAGSTNSGVMDASNLFKPALSRNKIKIIGITTQDEYKRFIEKEKAFSRRFQYIEVKEPSEEESYKIIKGIIEKYEDYHGVKYEDVAIRTAVELSKLYINEKFLPDKAIDVIDECGARIKLERYKTITNENYILELDQKNREEIEYKQNNIYTVTKEDIEEIVAKIAKIPKKSVENSEKERLSTLEEELKSVIFGQDQAIKELVLVAKKSRAGFREKDKNLANFLFIGPTGVGKTELAKQLANLLTMKFLRFDMSEYQEKHSISRLIGSPAGYVGYEEGGLLVEEIRKNPHCVLLLDEIEKANQDVFNILLQVMDYATLTDTKGRKADFRNVIIIMTSNAGAKEIGKYLIGFSERIVENEIVLDEVKKIFTPEFRNRIDKTIIFNKLKEDNLRSIVRKEIEKFENLIKDKNIIIKYDEDVIDLLLKDGESNEFGARNIARLVEDKVKNKFIDRVLFSDIDENVKTLAILSVSNGNIEVEFKEENLIY